MSRELTIILNLTIVYFYNIWLLLCIEEKVDTIFFKCISKYVTQLAIAKTELLISCLKNLRDIGDNTGWRGGIYVKDSFKLWVDPIKGQ